MANPRAHKTLYSVHPGVEMIQKWIAELKAKSGKTLDEWIAHCKKKGPKDETDLRDWLKAEHKFGTNSAWWIAERVHGKGSEEDTPEKYLASAERYVESMFAGPKAGLRPIYDELLSLGLAVGPNVKACPCQTIVPLYRNHVFAQIKPTTRTRIDMGYALRDTKPSGRLLDTGGFAKKDRITHRIPITTVGEIDDEVRKWMKRAYELDAD